VRTCRASSANSIDLKQNTIGLEEVNDGVWSIYLCNVLLARLDERGLSGLDAQGTHGKADLYTQWHK